MPRKSKLSAEEIEAANLAADDRKRNRDNGFSLMEIRDRGWARLQNGTVIEWYVEPAKRLNGTPYPTLQPGTFLLHSGKTHLLFDADDFRKWLRWV